MILLRFVLVGLAAFILIGLGWRLSSGPAAPPPSASAPAKAPVIAAPRAPAATKPAAENVPATPSVVQTRAAPPSAEAVQQAQAMLQQAPDLSRAFDLMKAQFPAAAERGLGEAAARLASADAKPSADDIFAAAMRGLRQSAGVLAAKASPEALGAIFDAQATTLADLAQVDPRVCADFLYGGTSPEYTDFAAAHRALVAQAAVADINAMAEGRKLQVKRGAPSAEDFKQVDSGLAARGLSPDEIAALLDGKSPDPPLSDARICENARTYLDVLRGLPADVRDRIYGMTAELLARS
jgi:hypothetical protein